MLGLPLREIWVCADFPLAKVRPMVEESGHPPQADPQAALQDLQALKARSTTQFKDIAKEPNNEIHADIEDQMDDYEPSIMGEDEQVVAPGDGEADQRRGHLDGPALFEQPGKEGRPVRLDSELLLEKKNGDGLEAKRQPQPRTPSHRTLRPAPLLLQARTVAAVPVREVAGR